MEKDKTQEGRKKAVSILTNALKQLPYNTESVFHELELKSGCLIYVPSRLRDNDKLQREKSAYKTILQYAGY